MSTTTTMTTRDRGDRYGPIEWAQQRLSLKNYCSSTDSLVCTASITHCIQLHIRTHHTTYLYQSKNCHFHAELDQHQLKHRVHLQQVDTTLADYNR